MAPQVTGKERQQRVSVRERAVEVEKRYRTGSGERAIDGAEDGFVQRITREYGCLCVLSRI
jgi:hypothetical protein